MVAESEADRRTEQAIREKLVSSAQRWTSEGGSECPTPRVNCCEDGNCLA